MSAPPLDPLGALRVVAELCSVLRRSGLAVSPAEVIDATRALATVGVDDRATFRAALGSCLVKRERDRATFDAAFERFFDPKQSAPVDLFDRLRASGFSEDELATLREILAAHAGGETLGALAGVGGGGELTRLLRRPDVMRALEGMTSSMQLGFFSMRVGERIGLGRASQDLAGIRLSLRGALGERGDAIADELQRALDATRTEIRDQLRRRVERRDVDARDRRRDKRLLATPFTSLGDDEVEEVRRAVRRLAEKLRGKARVRRRHAKKGPIDLRKTMRASWITQGVPIKPVRRTKRRDRPRLVLICDVSDSVRLAARFMLELVYALQELFDDTRSLVFVSDLGDVTELLRKEPVGVALARIFGGHAVSLTDNSNYGRALALFHRDHLARVDRRTTVVVLGDGRNNYQATEEWVLADVRRRARALLWINPERRGSWAIGDSAMNVYAPACTRVLEVATASELEEAARLLVAM